MVAVRWRSFKALYYLDQQNSELGYFGQGGSSLGRQMWSATHWTFINIPSGYNFMANPIKKHSSFSWWMYTWDDVPEKYSILQLNHSSFSEFEYNKSATTTTSEK